MLVQSLLAFWTEDILLALYQDPLVSRYTHEYIMTFLPALWFYALSDIQRKMLSVFGHTMITLISFMVAVFLHPLWCWSLTVNQKMGLHGIALAGVFTNFLMLLFMVGFGYLDREFRKTFVPIDRSAFQGLGEYITIGIPNTITMFLDFCAYDLMTVVSGNLGVKEQAAQVVLMNMTEYCYCIGFGL